MFDGKVIYEKSFAFMDELIEQVVLGDMPKDTKKETSTPEGTEEQPPSSYEEIIEEEARLACMDETDITYEEAAAEVTKHSTYLPMPNRQVSVNEFIRLAIRAGEDAMMDLKIVQGKYSTEAIFRADWLQGLLPLRPLFAIADDFRFMPRKDDAWSMNITFAYYTHIVLTHGRLFRPEF